MPERDNPIARIVARFGGTEALAQEIGRGQSTVADWVTKGMVPVHRIGDVIEAGRQMRPPIELEPNDFFPRTLKKRRGRAQRIPCNKTSERFGHGMR
jgi:hypothetical protein